MKVDKRCRETKIKRDKMTMSRLRYQMIASRVIDDQRILEYDWTRGTLGHN